LRAYSKLVWRRLEPSCGLVRADRAPRGSGRVAGAPAGPRERSEHGRPASRSSCTAAAPRRHYAAHAVDVEQNRAIDGESLQVTPRLALPLGEVVLRTSRSSGPGGQHAQKTDSRVEAVFEVVASQTLSEAQKRRVEARLGPVVRAVAQDERSQARNRELALERLAAQLRDALRVQRRRRPTVPTAASRARRLAEKRRRSETKRLRSEPPPEH
jgi:ribosome-associated protein